MIPPRPLARVLLAIAVAVAAVSPSTPRTDPPAPSPAVEGAAPGAGMMPLSEVRPGMIGTVRTVFEGDRIEEFQAEIVGVMDNFLGPGQDLILARLKGERVEKTGVAAGMSGSPVYIGGRLAGAISYRMGSFLKEPIAGITPIEYMLRVGSGPPESGPAASRAAVSAGSAPGEGSEAGRLEPIEAPIVAAGVPSRAIEIFSGELARLGLGRIGPGGTSGGAPAPASGVVGSAGPPSPGAPILRPGDPIAAQLVGGDLTLGATGTVTWVDGEKVYAFGHPSFLLGSADVPMARAEIYLTLSSLQASSKMGRLLDTIGTFKESRLPAITGVIGPRPRMIPVTVRFGTLDLDGSGGRGPERAYHYDVIEHREFTPPLVGLLAAASLFNTPWYADEMTLSLSGRIGLDGGRPDLIINDLYTAVSATQPAIAALARDVQGLFGVVFQNRFETVKVRSIDLKVDSVEKSRIGFVEGVYPTRTDLRPGDEVEFRVLIRRYRGEHYTRRFVYRVPEGTPEGTLNVYVGGANLMAATERNLIARQVSQADDLGQIITLINRLRTSDKLYMKIVRRQGGAVVVSEVMPALPPSVLTTLTANRGSGEVTPMAETTLHEEEIPVGEILAGGTMIPLNVH